MKDVSLIVYPATDMAATKQFFRELTGADPYADSAQYVGYKSGDMEIGFVPSQYQPYSIAYWTVSDINAKLQELTAAGGTVVKDVTDVGYGLLVANVKEPGGAVIGLRQFPKQ